MFTSVHAMKTAAAAQIVSAISLSFSVTPALVHRVSGHEVIVKVVHNPHRTTDHNDNDQDNKQECDRIPMRLGLKS